jgi:hypothetical protein
MAMESQSVIPLVLLFTMWLQPATAAPLAPPASPSPIPSPSTCDRAAEELFGRLPARPSGRGNEPKKIKHVSPRYPEIPPGTRGSGAWLGEALIDPDGRVRRVTVLRDLKFDPPFPAVSAAISDAILQWRYAPTIVEDRAIPVCMTISVNIHWK